MNETETTLSQIATQISEAIKEKEAQKGEVEPAAIPALDREIGQLKRQLQNIQDSERIQETAAHDTEGETLDEITKAKLVERKLYEEAVAAGVDFNNHADPMLVSAHRLSLTIELVDMLSDVINTNKERTQPFPDMGYFTKPLDEAIAIRAEQVNQALRLPAYMRKRIRQYTQARESLRMKGKAASIENIQELLSWSDNAMRSVVETIRKAEMQSLDYNLNENEKDSVTVLDMIAASENVEEDALSGSYLEGLHSLLQLALGELPNRERTVLQALFFQGLSYKELADCFGCTKQNISKIKGDAYKNIRMGKYGSELLSYLPDRKAKRAKKRIDQDFKELSEDERDLLL